MSKNNISKKEEQNEEESTNSSTNHHPRTISSSRYLESKSPSKIEKTIKDQKRVMIGPKFQVDIENIPIKSEQKNIKRKHSLISNSRFKEEKVVWMSGKLSKEAVKEFVETAKKLFKKKIFKIVTREGRENVNYSPNFCLQKCLFLLHSCDYNLELAKSLVLLPTMDIQNDTLKSSEEEEFNEEEDFCFICRDGGNLLLCDYENCKRVYHALCAKLKHIPDGEWNCPSHFCSICHEPSKKEFSCCFCSTSYCSSHLPPKCRQIDAPEFMCTSCLEEKIDPQIRFYERLNALFKRKNRVLKTFKVGGIILNYFTFYRAVLCFGGAKRVTDSLSWTKIKSVLGIAEAATNASSLLKSIYIGTLFLYEQIFYPNSLPLDGGFVSLKRSRTNKVKIKTPVIQENDTCDVVVTKVNEFYLSIEVAIKGRIKHGILFLPQKLQKENISQPPIKQDNSSSKNIPPIPPTIINSPASNSTSKSDKNMTAVRKTESEIDELLREISAYSSPENPHFEKVFLMKGALRKMRQSKTVLMKELALSREEMNLFLFASEKKPCPLYIIFKIDQWFEGLSERVKSYVLASVENFKFKSLVKFENLRVRKKQINML